MEKGGRGDQGEASEKTCLAHTKCGITNAVLDIAFAQENAEGVCRSRSAHVANTSILGTRVTAFLTALLCKPSKMRRTCVCRASSRFRRGGGAKPLTNWPSAVRKNGRPHAISSCAASSQ